MPTRRSDSGSSTASYGWYESTQHSRPSTGRLLKHISASWSVTSSPASGLRSNTSTGRYWTPVSRPSTSRSPERSQPNLVGHSTGSPATTRCRRRQIIGVGNVVVDITEHKEAEEFRAVVMDNMAEGLYALDADGLVTYMNPAASTMLGWTEQELRGKPMHETVHFQRADGTPFPVEECALLQVRTEGRSIRIPDDAYTRKDGSHLPVAYSLRRCEAGTPSRVSWLSSVTSPRRSRERAAGGKSSTPSRGSGASATRSTRTGSSCTPSPSCPSPAGGRAKSCCCA